MDMTHYLVLLRGINVGGRNKVPMKELRSALESRGYRDVSTYIASGNVLLASADAPERLGPDIEAALVENFALDDDLVRVLVLGRRELQQVIEHRPGAFGEHPDTYHSDAIFLIDVDVATALEAFRLREGIDAVWPGDGVVYSQRLSAQLGKSRLSAIASSPLYKSMTIRSWRTTQKLWELLQDRETAGRDPG